MQKIFRLAACFGACLLGLAAQATPVASSIGSGFSLLPYQGTAALNAGLVDRDNSLFFLKERQVDGLQSWYLIFDPKASQRIVAQIDFGAPIVSVIGDFAGLLLTQGQYGIGIHGGDQASTYAVKGSMGLERSDKVAWIAGDSLLSIDWRASDPGDHARILVQAPAAAQVLPEPGTLALVASTLMLGATVVRWRRR